MDIQFEDDPFEPNPQTIERIIQVESSGNPNATSPTGARGLMQVLPSTARYYGFDPDKLYDPDYGRMAGYTVYKDYLKKAGGDERTALMMYKEGPAGYKGKHRARAEAYADKVLGHAAINPYTDLEDVPEDKPPVRSEDRADLYPEFYRLNQPYAKPGPYVTALSPAEEQEYRGWAAQRKIHPDDVTYDNRGFWKAMKAGDPRARTAMNTTAGEVHGPDIWKTPYDPSFSNESIYAQPNAPRWKGRYLVDQSGKRLFDDQTGQRIMEPSYAHYVDEGMDNPAEKLRGAAANLLGKPAEMIANQLRPIFEKVLGQENAEPLLQAVSNAVGSFAGGVPEGSMGISRAMLRGEMPANIPPEPPRGPGYQGPAEDVAPSDQRLLEGPATEPHINDIARAPAIRNPETQEVTEGQVGDTHADIADRTANLPARIEHGFMTHDGRFLTRTQARQMLNARGAKLPAGKPESIDMLPPFEGEPDTEIPADAPKLTAQKNHRYRDFDSPDEAVGSDRSSSQEPFSYGGAYSIEFKGGAGGQPLGPAHKGSIRGPIDPLDVTRVFYNPDQWVPEARRLRTTQDLARMRRMFPNAQFVQTAINDEGEPVVIGQKPTAPIAMPARTIGQVAVAPAIRYQGRILVGRPNQIHSQILEEHGIDPSEGNFQEGDLGFVDANGRYFTRQDMKRETPASFPTYHVPHATDLESDLYKLDRMDEAEAAARKLQGAQSEPENSPEYESAYQKAKAASAKFHDAQQAYRARQIGDNEFLAARAEFDQSQREFDAAHAAESAKSPAISPESAPPSQETAPVPAPVSGPSLESPSPAAAITSASPQGTAKTQRDVFLEMVDKLKATEAEKAALRQFFSHEAFNTHRGLGSGPTMNAMVKMKLAQLRSAPPSEPAAPSEESAPPMEDAEPQKGDYPWEVHGVPGKPIVSVDPKQVVMDPDTFQYKTSVDKATGRGNSLKGVKYDWRRANNVTFYWDAEAKKIYVSHGHHRHPAALEANEPSEYGHLLDSGEDAPGAVMHNVTKADARALGALDNFADGQGTVIDAATYLRNAPRDFTDDELRDMGIDASKKMIQEALGLKHLDPLVWHEVAIGRLKPEVGAIIGRELENGRDQVDAFREWKEKADTGRPYSLDRFEFMQKLRADAPATYKEQQTLFGKDVEVRNTWAEQADILAEVRDKLNGIISGTRAVSKHQEMLQRIGNVLNIEDTEAVKGIAEAQRKQLNGYKPGQRPAMRRVLERFGRYLAEKPKQRKEILNEAYEAMLKAIDEDVPGTSTAKEAPSDTQKSLF